MTGIEKLSKSEKKVLELLAQDRVYIEIAVVSGISVNTVKKHLKNVYKKLGVHNRKEAIQRFHEQSDMSA